MRIVVCVKQVPEVTSVQVDPHTGTLMREGVQSILNPFCEYALDHAVKLAGLVNNVDITVISMGPPQAKGALVRCLELGADQAVLVTDRKFAGADTWATAYTLTAAIRLAVPDFDLILAGKQAIDGDTAQVGPEMAEILGIPQVTYGVSLTVGGSRNSICVRREVEQGYETIQTTCPALVTISKGEAVRRAPSFLAVAEARRKPISIISADLLGIPAKELGLQGSFTQVVKVFPPAQKKTSRFVRDVEADQAAAEIFAFLKENRFIQ